MTQTLRHILITGATGGIGAAAATMLADSDTRLTLVARNPQRLKWLADRLAARGAAVTTIAADLTVHDAADAVAAEALQRQGGVDVLVNGAGINDFRRCADMAPATIAALLNTNLLGAIQLCRSVLPGMLQRRRGRIVNVGSVMGGVGFAGFSVYCATKFGLRGFSEALRRELDGSGVSVAHVAPRYTRTALNTAAMDRMAHTVGMKTDSAEVAARAIVTAVNGNKSEYVIGAAERLLVRLNGLLPGFVDTSLAKLNRRMLEHVEGAGSGGGIIEKESVT